MINTHDEEESMYFEAILHDRKLPLTSKIIASCIDRTNQHLYLLNSNGTFLVLDYTAPPSEPSKFNIKSFTLDLEVKEYKAKMCSEMDGRGDVFILGMKQLSSILYRFNIYTRELRVIEKKHEVLNYFATNMVLHDDKVAFYGAKFKSGISHLVEYDILKDSLETVRVFKDEEGKDDFNYQYPDPYIITHYNNKYITIGSTSFSYQAFSNGRADRDVWIFSQNEFQRIPTRNCELWYNTDVEPLASCYVPYGNSIAGVFLSGYDEVTGYIIKKVGMLIIPPMNKLEDTEELKWKIFELPKEVSEKLKVNCSFFQLIDYISEKYYKFLIGQQQNIYELELVLDKYLVANSARNVFIKNVPQFYDIDFEFIEI